MKSFSFPVAAAFPLLLMSTQVFAPGQSFGEAKSKGPGFPCEKAATPVEKIICGSEKLMGLDREMSELYASAKIKNGNVAFSQKQWLQRRDKLADEPLLASAYEKRIRYLQQIGTGKRDSFEPMASTTIEASDKPGARKYQLPAECDEFLKAGDGLIDQAPNQMQANYYTYQLGQCRFHEALQAGSGQASRDFLQDTDFWYLPLAELPFISCDVGLGEGSFMKKCAEYGSRKMQLTQLAQAVHYDEKKKEYAIADRSAGKAIKGNCRLQEGEFVGTIVYGATTVTCTNNSDKPDIQGEDSGFAITAFAFRDLNRDGTMDAILHIADVSGGTAKSSGVIMVTREKAGAPLKRLYGAAPGL